MLPPLSPSHSSLQVSLTWSQTPTTCKRPLTSREPTCTPCAVLRRRSAWPGKEMTCGQSLGVTQNLSAGCTTLVFSLVGLVCPQSFKWGREWGDPAFMYTSSCKELNDISSSRPLVIKKPACQCRRHKRKGFYPWVGKIPWRRKWQLTPVFLPGESLGQRSLVGYSPWGCRVRHDRAI